MILEIITGITSTFMGVFFIGLPIYSWEEVELFLAPEDVPTMKIMLILVEIIGITFFISGTLTLLNLIG